MPKLGRSPKLLIIVLVLLAIFAVGFLSGDLVASIMGTPQTPPKVELPAEKISSVLGFPITNTLLAAWLTIIVLVSLFYLATRRIKLIPSRWQSAMEIPIEMLLNFVEGVAGKKNGRRFFPIVATIFLFVIANAWLCLIPGFGSITAPGREVPLLRGANTDMNLPIALALMSFIAVEYWGMSSVGALRYLRQFINLGQLFQGIKQLFTGHLKRGATGVFSGIINAFVGALEGILHFVRIVSFAFRLFGNMLAGEILLLIIFFLGLWVVVDLFYALEIFVGFVQALIFSGLTLIFATLAVSPHGEEQT